MTDLDRARRVFSRTVFATETTGCVIDAVGPGYARCSLRVGPGHLNALGHPMGGAVFTLADFAFGVASNFDRDVFVTTSAEVHFLTAARGEVLTAEAREIRSGRRTCLFEIRVRDELGTEAAYLTMSGLKTAERKRKGNPDGT